MKNNIEKIDAEVNEDEVNDAEVDEEIIQSYLSKMSKSEKFFWGTIVIFMFIFIAVSLMALWNTTKDNITEHQQKTVSGEIIEKWFNVDTIKQNISDHETDINDSLNVELASIYRTIDRDINNIFYSVEKNVDIYLDYHYSIVGEYVELGTMAFGDIDKMIEEKLFGKDFTDRLNRSAAYMEKEYIDGKKNHLTIVHGYAMKNVDIDDNSEALTQLTTDVNSSLAKPSKAAKLVGASISLKIAAAISAKIAIKIASKSVLKGTSKVAVKSAAASTGAAAGLWCGPLFWVCSPAAAGALWLATDYIVVSGDEYFTRDELEKEIMLSLNESKIRLINSYKEFYFQEFSEFSKSVKEKYKKTTIKEKRKIRNMF